MAKTTNIHIKNIFYNYKQKMGLWLMTQNLNICIILHKKYIFSKNEPNFDT